MIIDRVTMLNKGEVLAYSGGVSGDFIHQQANKVTYGTYEGAFQNIGDALFRPSYTETCETVQEAKITAFKEAGLKYGDVVDFRKTN